jgi:hypothetical protein
VRSGIEDRTLVRDRSVSFGFSTSIVNGGDFRVALHGIYARGVGTTLRSEIAHFFDAEISFCRFR